jgi:hypothetical protein
MINVVSTLCDADGCDTIAIYNVRGEKARFCSDHKTPDMVDVTHTLCELCDTRPRYGHLGKRATHCAPINKRE